MAPSAAATVDEYLASLPGERRASIETVRRTILANLPAGYDESMMWGMVTYSVPLSRFADTYNGQPLCLAGLASQKNYMAVYLMGVYCESATRKWFEAAYRQSGKKLDMGKSCVRFKTLDDLPLDVVGQAIARFGVDQYVSIYESVRKATAGNKAAAGKRTAAAKKAKKASASRKH